MTSNEIAAEVAKIITALRRDLPKGGRRQYPAAKHQIASLTELGLIEAMPRGFGYQDAAEVIRQATRGSRADGAMNASGEGEEWTTEATALYNLLNPAPVATETTSTEMNEYDPTNEIDPQIAIEEARHIQHMLNSLDPTEAELADAE